LDDRRFGSRSPILVLVVAAVIIIILILTHVDVVEHQPHEVAADFLDHLLGAQGHGHRVAAVLDDLQNHVHFAGQNGSVAHAKQRRRVKKDEFVTVSRIGTGLSDDEWREIHKRADKIRLDHKPARVDSVIEPSVWIKPEIVIEVLADEITRSPMHTAGKKDGEPGFALRFPRLVSFRNADKKPEDATSVKELIEMYSQQGKK